MVLEMQEARLPDVIERIYINYFIIIICLQAYNAIPHSV